MAVPGEKTSTSLNGGNDNDGVPVCPPHTTERKLLARIDVRVVPFLCIMYLLAFLDRVNISNAALFGLSEDLNLGTTGTKFNVALVIFFVPYCVFEIPSNILLKRFRPHVWLAANMFLFGLTTLLQGFVGNYAGLLACRFFLGLFETGMFPGAFYLIGMWYRRHEAQKRYSFFFNSTTLAGAFGGLLAAAIGTMGGLGGYSGWRWIFIVEGAITVLASLFFFFLLPDFPEDSAWLSADEKEYVAARLRLDQGGAGPERSVSLRDVVEVLSDYRVLLGGFMYLGLLVPAYGYAYFSPFIIRGYGYSPIEAQLHSVPPWAVAFVVSMLVAYSSDRLRHRCAFALASAVGDRRNLQYAALFLYAAGAFTAMPIVICWFNMNLGGHHRRAIGSAWQVGFGNLGGIVAVFIFQKKDGPRYVPGLAVSLGFAVLGAVACSVYAWACCKANRDRRRAGGAASALSEGEKTALGDKSPDYRYLL
ncbi:major facilitator superfamily transporter [Ophiocordyceps sinensis CO18]|uniref:Major facilitator superfamily transporter n=1 Tax=Ophiocordyceps sinensis (strain Co18 / CGMCC 3.14243) TaxID=911162 RepID=T5AE00_OPHSC|nr:major facilitator superfamily transporter [Ophiocordyceps sinensis CO18]